jgi:hypothetical protein
VNRWVVAIVIWVLPVAGCTNEDEARPVGRPSAAASERDRESATRAREKDWPLERASSDNAVLGVAAQFKLYTHCGVDFDGSFWDAIREAEAIDNGDYRGLLDPSDRGTMTLVAANRARYESNSGVTIDYSRAGDKRRISPCY